MEKPKHSQLHKIHTGPFTGPELSDGFTDYLEEEAAMDEEANDLHFDLNDQGEIEGYAINGFE